MALEDIIRNWTEYGYRYTLRRTFLRFIYQEALKLLLLLQRYYFLEMDYSGDLYGGSHEAF